MTFLAKRKDANASDATVLPPQPLLHALVPAFRALRGVLNELVTAFDKVCLRPCLRCCVLLAPPAPTSLVGRMQGDMIRPVQQACFTRLFELMSTIAACDALVSEPAGQATASSCLAAFFGPAGSQAVS